MNTNQKISLALLIGRLVSVSFMALVVSKQYKVLRAKNYPELKRLRTTLLVGSCIILAGNIIPIVIDTLGIFGMGSFALLLAYVFSNNLTAMLAAYMMWYSIRISEKTEVILQADRDSEYQKSNV
jgi:hypothetical protein